MTDFRALIFDLDGVLVNTVDLHFRSWQHLARQNGLGFSRAMMEGFRGKHREDCVRDLFAPHILTHHEIERFLKLKTEFYLNELSKCPPESLVLDGVVALLQAAKEAGLRIGVASSSVNAGMVLASSGLSQWIEALADGNTCVRPKPEPDGFLWVAGALRVPPVNCIAFEDSAVGIAAAQTAGMRVVGIGSGARVRQAHLVYENMSDIELVTLLEVLFGKQVIKE